LKKKILLTSLYLSLNLQSSPLTHSFSCPSDFVCIDANERKVVYGVYTFLEELEEQQVWATQRYASP